MQPATTPQPVPPWLPGAQWSEVREATPWPEPTPEMHRAWMDRNLRAQRAEPQSDMTEEPGGSARDSLIEPNGPLFLQSGLVPAPPSGRRAPPWLDLSDPRAVAAYRLSQGAKSTFGRGDPERAEAAIRAGLVSAADPFGIPSWLIGQVSPATKDLIREQYEDHPIAATIGSFATSIPRFVMRGAEIAAKAAPKTLATVLGLGGLATSSDEAEGAGRPPRGKPPRMGRSAVDKYWRNVPTDLRSVPEAEKATLPGGKGEVIKETVAKPAIRNNDAPLFDYSRLHEVPNVPQFNLDRYVPPRGVPKRILEVAKPENIDRVNKTVEEGIKMGGPAWWNTQPLRYSYIEELGKGGDANYRQFIDFVVANSPRADIVSAIRNASYHYSRVQRGEPLPELVRIDNKWALKESLPRPYGRHPLAGLHVKLMGDVLEGRGFPPLTAPKLASMSENLQGNYVPTTNDIHVSRLWGVVNPMGRLVLVPRAGYGFLETLQQGQAPKFDLMPAQYQSSGWIGGAERTGVRSPRDPILKVLDQRIAITADVLGLTKQETFRRFKRGELKLLGIAGAGAAGVGARERLD
jgi:hypothetical protein